MWSSFTHEFVEFIHCTGGIKQRQGSKAPRRSKRFAQKSPKSVCSVMVTIPEGVPPPAVISSNLPSLGDVSSTASKGRTVHGHGAKRLRSCISTDLSNLHLIAYVFQMTATVSFERQLWEYIQRVCPSPEDFVTFIVVTIAIIRIIQLVRASPRVSSIFAGCWVVWLITAGFDDRYLIPRFKAVISTTRVAVQSSATASLAWLELVLPFASDVLRLSVNLYEILPWQGKVAVVILSASLYGIFAAVTKVREKGDIIVYALYQFSYIVVAPALYYGFKRLPQTWIPSIISSIIYVLPVILSLYHFHGAKTDPRSKHKVYTEMWLSYFSLYPLIVILKDVIEKTSLDTHSFHLTLVPVIIWAQFWSGSRICFEFIRKLISLTIGLVPQVYSKVFNREITLPSQMYGSIISMTH